MKPKMKIGAMTMRLHEKDDRDSTREEENKRIRLSPHLPAGRSDSTSCLFRRHLSVRWVQSFSFCDPGEGGRKERNKKKKKGSGPTDILRTERGHFLSRREHDPTRHAKRAGLLAWPTQPMLPDGPECLAFGLRKKKEKKKKKKRGLLRRQPLPPPAAAAAATAAARNASPAGPKEQKQH